MGEKMRIPVRDRMGRSSVWAFFREGRRTPGYSFWDLLHGYVYGRWPYHYIGIGVGEHPWVKRYGPFVERILRLWNRLRPAEAKQPKKAVHPLDLNPDVATHTTADGYHGKVVPLEAARQLVMVNEPIRLPNLEQIIPYVRARDIILQNPDHIIALECPCRSSRANPCLPLDVCLIVGEPFASFVSDHHPDKTRWLSPDEAVEILQAEDARGHVHHAFFKDAMLGRFYAICNCCACCCGAMQMHQNGTPMLASSGYVCVVDEEVCIGCETCEQVCQFEAITVPEYVSQVDPRACMGCGVCVEHCDQGALSLQRDPGRSEPLEIFELIGSVG